MFRAENLEVQNDITNTSNFFRDTLAIPTLYEHECSNKIRSDYCGVSVILEKLQDFYMTEDKDICIIYIAGNGDKNGRFLVDTKEGVENLLCDDVYGMWKRLNRNKKVHAV